MSNEELITEIKADRNTADNLLQLYSQNRGIIYKWCLPLSESIDIADLMQESFIALCEAVNYYDGNREERSFLSCLRYCMLRHFRSMIRESRDIMIPFDLSEMIRQYKRMRDSYMKTLGKEPADQVYCHTLNVTLSELAKIRKYADCSKAVSLYMPLSYNDNDDMTLENSIPDKNNDIDNKLDQIEHEQLSAILNRMLERLTEDQKTVIRWRFFEQLTLQECADRMEKTPEQIRQKEMKALQELRKPTDSFKALREFIPEAVIYDFAMIRRGVNTFRITHESATETAAFNLMQYREKLRSSAQYVQA